jgi:acyl-CoA thioesterase I
MKRVLVFMICACLADIAVAGEKSRFVSQLDEGKAQTIAVYGTSLTAGGQWSKQFAAVLAAKYGEKALFRNAASAGKDSNWGLENIEERVFPHQPDLLFVEFAMNDAIKPRGTSVDQARKNLETMLDMTRKKFPKCEIMLMSMNPDVKHLLLKRPSSGRPNLPEYYAMYAEVAKKRDLHFIDLFKAWNAFLRDDLDTMQKHIPDGVHPNGPGTKMVITPTVLKAIGVAFEPKDIPQYPDRVKKRPPTKKPKKKG